MGLPITSTPAVILNGAGVYDYEHEKMLWFQEINPAGYEIVSAVMKKFPSVEVEILTKDKAYAVNAHVFANVMLHADRLLPHKRFSKISQGSAGRVGEGYILRPTDNNRFRKKIPAFN